MTPEIVSVIAWPSVAALGVIALAILIGANKLKTLSIGAKDKTLSIGAGEDVESIDERIDSFIEQKHRVERKITAAQTRLIRGTIERFTDVFAGTDPLVAMSLWSRFADELYLAAVENHVLSKLVPVDSRYPEGEKKLEDYYIEEKLVSVKEAHKRLASKYDLPAWTEAEGGVRDTMAHYLGQFAEIARVEWGAFREAAETVSRSIERTSPHGAKRIRRLIGNQEE